MSSLSQDAQRTGLYAGWELEFRPPGPLLIENIKLNLRTKVEIYSSSPNYSLDLQLADDTMSSPTCIKPNVACNPMFTHLLSISDNI
jgi:hypothetical protein